MAKKSLKLCRLAQHIVKLLAESSRPGHGRTYARDKAHELDGLPTHDVVSWAGIRLDGRNLNSLAEAIEEASGRTIYALDLSAAARVAVAIDALPPLDLQELLA